MFELLFVKSLYLFNNWKLHKIMFNSLIEIHVCICCKNDKSTTFFGNT